MNNLSWVLENIALAELEQIESGRLEILGEDEQGGSVSCEVDIFAAAHEARARILELEKRVEELQLDSDRWNALINAPFRLFGFAGMDCEDPTKACGKYGLEGYAHFGCEMWTTHDGYDSETGKAVLTGFADQAIRAKGGKYDL